MPTAIALAMFFVAAAGAFSGMETGAYTVSRLRLQAQAEKGVAAALTLRANLSDPQIFVFTMLVGHNLCLDLASLAATRLFEDAGVGGGRLLGLVPWSPEVAATLALELPVFIFAEVWPKTLFLKNADTLMYPAAGLQRFFIVLFSPVSMPLKWLARGLSPRGGGESAKGFLHASLRALRHTLKEGHRGGAISDRQNRMVDKLLSFNDTPVEAAMRRADSLPALPPESPPGAFLAPLKADRNADHAFSCDVRGMPCGYIPFFDVLAASMGGAADMRGLVRPLKAMACGTSLQKALYLLQTWREPVGAVVNSKGRVVGVVAAKDILRLLAD